MSLGSLRLGYKFLHRTPEGVWRAHSGPLSTTPLREVTGLRVTNFNSLPSPRSSTFLATLALISSCGTYRINHERAAKYYYKSRGEIDRSKETGIARNEDRVPFDNYGPGGLSRGIARKISSNYNIHLHPGLN